MNSNKYKGVTMHKPSGKWQAIIRLNGKAKWIGYAPDELGALDKVNEANAKYYPDNPEFQQVEIEENKIDYDKVVCGKW